MQGKMYEQTRRGCLFRGFRDDRVEECVGRDQPPLLRCEPDNTGFFRSDIGLHQIMLIIHEAIIRLCIGVDLLQGFFVQLIAGVLGNVLVQGIDDLLFQVCVLCIFFTA